MKYPTVIIENFFEKPHDIIEYSKTLEYRSPKKDEYWKGVRSENISLINEELNRFIISKIFAIFYNYNYEQIGVYKTGIYFHKIRYNDIKNLKTYLHRDAEQSLTGIIYLNEKENNLKTGTKIAKDKKNDKVLVANSFNTLLCYEGNQLHGPTGFLSDNSERLTIVFFIGQIKAKEYPLDRIRKIKGF